MKGSLVIVAFFILGILCAVLDLIPTSLLACDLDYYALVVLLFCVGLSVGSDGAFLSKVKSLNRRLLLLPFFTILGTLGGSALASLMLDGRRLFDCLAVGSGMAYYSLSSILITEYRGAELGTIALLANIIREVATLILAPLMVRFFGRLAPISAGGATTMDTTLPIITRTSGDRYTILSIYHGALVDFSVPFLVSFWCA
jgi:uncharacterized membrane protein YbjE (DUF340 family)